MAFVLTTAEEITDAIDAMIEQAFSKHMSDQ